MFILNIISTQGVPLSNQLAGTLELSSPAFGSSPIVNPFPQAGGVATIPLSVLATPSFFLKCRVTIGPDTLAFGLSHLLPDDTLNVVRHDVFAFTATIFHLTRHSADVTCMATCADGTQAQGCVLCQSGSIKGKICC